MKNFLLLNNLIFFIIYYSFFKQYNNSLQSKILTKFRFILVWSKKMLILLVWSYYSLNSDHFSSNNESGAAMLAFYMIYCPFIISSIQHCCSWNWNEFSEFSQEMTILTIVMLEPQMCLNVPHSRSCKGRLLKQFQKIFSLSVIRSDGKWKWSYQTV